MTTDTAKANKQAIIEARDSTYGQPSIRSSDISQRNTEGKPSKQQRQGQTSSLHIGQLVQAASEALIQDASRRTDANDTTIDIGGVRSAETDRDQMLKHWGSISEFLNVPKDSEAFNQQKTSIELGQNLGNTSVGELVDQHMSELQPLLRKRNQSIGHLNGEQLEHGIHRQNSQSINVFNRPSGNSFIRNHAKSLIQSIN